MRTQSKRLRAVTIGLLAAAAIAAAPASVAVEAGPTTPAAALDPAAPVDTPATDATPLTDLAAVADAAQAAQAAPSVEAAVAAPVDASTADALHARVLVEARTAHAQALRARIVALAKAQVGDRYRAGASGPNAFDCSGLVRFVYGKVAGIDLAHYSRTQFKGAKRVKLADIQPGDLVFFLRGSHHVGIYIGDGKMVDAAKPGSGVRISPIRGDWWGRHFTGIGRILPA